ncbi:MAG: hypothetical protein OIN88_15575 [Candidatus Methanoperedens sp.]|nr:hypothetical protein [Candidatus Methanoperedens sp.]MCZ7361716.1 hypothetical protein [Candidatus Methanoperedens sp.]
MERNIRNASTSSSIFSMLLKNSVESYPRRDKIVLIMKDLAWVEQAVG